MKPIFSTVHDAVTDKSMLIRVDLVQKIWETELNGKECRVIQFINGDIEYVHNSLLVLANEFNQL